MPIQPSPGKGLGRVPLRIAGLYAVFGLLWIWLSDSALVWLGIAADRGFLAVVGKGTAFVCVTAVLLYWLVRREMVRARRSESLLRAVVEGTTDAVFVKDRDGRYLLFNEAAAAFVGKPVAEVLGRDDTALFDAVDAQRIMADDRKIMASGRVVSGDEVLTSANAKRTCHATKAPFRDATGAVVGVVGVSRDITERKATEDALRDSEKRYRELANAIPQIVWTAGPDGAVTHLNSKVVEYTGLAVADLTGWSWEQAIHPDDVDHARGEWLHALRDRVSRPFEMRIRRADGEYRWHIVRQLPIFNPGGEIESWVGTCTDIDDLSRTENTLRETEARLREAQRIASLGSWSWEPTTGRVWWSDAEFELFGVDQLAVHPSFEAFLGLLHPDDRAIAIARVESMMAGADEFANDLRIIRPDGSSMWIHSRARATREADGRIIRVEGTDQDITARRLAEEALRASESRYRLMFESNPHPMWVYNVDSFKFLAVNDSAVLAYGYSRDEFLAMSIRDIRPAEDVERLESTVARTTQGLMRSAHWRHRRKDGTVLHVDVSSHSLPDADGRSRLVLALDVTDRLRAEEGLRESERRLRLALEAAGAIAFTWDIKHDVVTRYFSTEPALPVTGESLGTLDNVRDRIHPDDLATFDTRLSASLAAGDDYRNQYRVVRPDGSTTTLEEYGCLDRAADGSPLRLNGISIDINDRMIAMEALRESEERYRRLLSVLPTAVLVHNGERVLYSNPAFVRLVGVESAEEMLDRRPIDFVDPEDRPLVLTRLSEMSATGEPSTGAEIRLLRIDGRSVPTYSVSTPVTGYGSHAFLVALSDMTERERATQLLRSVLSSVSDAILTIDERGVIGSANPAAARQFGYSEDELVGQNLRMLMPSPHREAYDGYLADYLFTGVAKVISSGREVECLRRDGTQFPAELTVTEFPLEGERHFTGVLRDITERQRLQTQFIQAQKMEAVGRLAGGVAHDFNNLMTIINGYCDLLMTSDLPGEDKLREAIATIRDAGERAARLTQQLLAFSRKAVIEPKVIDLNELVSNSATLLRRLIGEDIRLAVVISPTPIRVKVDPGQLEQVIMNLFVNARDAMPTGGRLTIETATIPAHDSVSSSFASLSVKDTGHGMSDDVKEKIFEPFFTTKGVGKGTGLGLAVVHGVITQSGGLIAIESSVGIGTTFRILLPLITDAPSGLTADSHRIAARGAETVLLVEDDEAVRKITRLSLQTQGYFVIEADGVAAAIAQAKNYNGEIHLMVSDVVMPDMGGRQLLNAVRHHRPGLRVLFMSGYTDDAVLLHGVVEATDAFIQKPFTLLSLARKVREVIDAPVR